MTLSYTNRGNLLLPRPILTAVVALLSELSDFEEQLSVISVPVFEDDNKWKGEETTILVRDLFLSKLQETLDDLVRVHGTRYETLIQQWPMVEEVRVLQHRGTYWRLNPAVRQGQEQEEEPEASDKENDVSEAVRHTIVHRGN